jgi:hypothetical protein
VKSARLARDLAAEQRAFLRRDRARWDDHLARARAFLGDGLRAAGDAPALILGAGSGLEVPWRLAPAGTVGWDADPWSRLRTGLRHRTWPPWVFQDLTGGLRELTEVAWRCARRPWSGTVRHHPAAARRLAGLTAGLRPRPEPLLDWLREHRPGTILVANVMGQFGVAAERAVTGAFAGQRPGNPDPDAPDVLEEALAAWTARAVRAFLAAMLASGADLWLLHDRGVLFGPAPVTLGPLAEPWTAQLRGAAAVEAADPLCGVDVLAELGGRRFERHERWLWPVAPGQLHVMEALRVVPAVASLNNPSTRGFTP